MHTRILQLYTNQQHVQNKTQAAQNPGQKEIIHTYGPKSTPIAQGLVEDTNAMHAYGRTSAPIAQGLAYDTNEPHAFGLRESKPNAIYAYGVALHP